MVPISNASNYDLREREVIGLKPDIEGFKNLRIEVAAIVVTATCISLNRKYLQTFKEEETNAQEAYDNMLKNYELLYPEYETCRDLGKSEEFNKLKNQLNDLYRRIVATGSLIDIAGIALWNEQRKLSNNQKYYNEHSQAVLNLQDLTDEETNALELAQKLVL